MLPFLNALHALRAVGAGALGGGRPARGFATTPRRATGADDFPLEVTTGAEGRGSSHDCTLSSLRLVPRRMAPMSSVAIFSQRYAEAATVTPMPWASTA